MTSNDSQWGRSTTYFPDDQLRREALEARDEASKRDPADPQPPRETLDQPTLESPLAKPDPSDTLSTGRLPAIGAQKGDPRLDFYPGW
jgi:hypothetical protein